MQSMDWVAVFVRWLHIVPAITLLGGTMFLAFVAVPSSGSVDGAAPSWMASIRTRWAMISGICILLLLVSGLWNFFNYRMEAVSDTGPLYHALFGTKALLALAVFFIVSVMAGRSPTFEPMRAKPGKMLMMAALMGLVIVLISGVLRGVEKDTGLPSSPPDVQLPGG